MRLLLALAFAGAAWFAISNSGSFTYIISMFIFAVLFIYLMRLHGITARAKVRAEALLNINNDEIDYLENNNIPFKDGSEFVDFKHPYSYDLDIFGQQSLYHNVNRTATYRGGEKLSELLLSTLSHGDIFSNQEAIKELAGKTEFRQEVMSLGKIGKDAKPAYEKLIAWSQKPVAKLTTSVKIISYASPVLLFSCLILYWFTGEAILLNTSGYLFSFNVMFLFSKAKMISNETGTSTEIAAIIQSYSIIIRELEKEEFVSARLKTLQKKLTSGTVPASVHIKNLAELFSRMDSINNIFAAVVFNGAFLFHIHTLRSLHKWKVKHAANINAWLDVIGEFEALGSLANLYYNNPDFTFPVLNNNYEISFNNLAHPLIKRTVRVGNDVLFNPQFMVLTGSNMSGKSTFLRSLGINMVLAGMGAPVCATSAKVHPLPVLVSMRLSDSLSDSESYFFAEIKRLKLIMDQLSEGRAFVLLDEILRGTNSDDKRTGTIEVVKKMIARKAIGAIATHDIEVCNTTYEYPGQLTNQCFEVQIVNNELYFDYTLREGICKNKSATFLMEKMGVI